MKRILFLFACQTFIMLFTAQERILVDETFDSNKNSWREKDEEDFETKLKGGQYVMKVAGINSKWVLKSTDLDGENEHFMIETNLELKKGDENTAYGLVFGMYNDNSNYKIFYITNTGFFKLVHFFNNTTKTIIEWTKTDKITKSKNKLTVKRNFNCLELLINDALVKTYCEFNWWGPKFGFYVGEKQTVLVDDVKMTASPLKHTSTENALNANVKKENIGKLVNSKYSENSPVISPDGKTLYYCLYYSPENTADLNKTDIYYSELQPDKTWGKYKSIGKPLNNSSSNWVISVSPDNNSMVVGNTYKADGESGGGGISISKRGADNNWQLPVAQEISDFKNLNQYASYFITSDNKIMLLGVEDKTSYGGQDLYVSFLESEGKWSKPKNLGSIINTACSDFGPFLAADGKTLYYASYGFESYGSADIFMSTRLDDSWTNWSKPVNLGPSINSSGWESAFSIAAKGDYAYMISEEGGVDGSPDIFRIKLTEEQKPEPVLLIYGKVLNKKTNEPLESIISYSDLITNKEIGVASSNAADGSYKIVLPMGKLYGFLASREGFYPISENIRIDTLKEYIEIERNLYLAPAEIGQAIVLNNIFFDFNKATLKSESAAELDRLVEFLSKNPTTNIEVSGHTDNIGADDYNTRLSQQRSESVMNYLLEKGIAKTRLSAKGYGKSKPVAANDTEDGRAKNRRVEFLILAK